MTFRTTETSTFHLPKHQDLFMYNMNGQNYYFVNEFSDFCVY